MVLQDRCYENLGVASMSNILEILPYLTSLDLERKQAKILKFWVSAFIINFFNSVEYQENPCRSVSRLDTLGKE